MWRCRNCGAKNQSDALCTGCGRPIDEALAAIRWKAQSVRLHNGLANRWMRQGARIGFVAGLVLSLLPWTCVLVGGLIKRPSMIVLAEAFAVMIPFVLLVALLSALLFAAIFLLVGAIKPIWSALFCSAERFEQEYGSTKQ
jgi:uncharacterized membrane protein YvbJ